MKKHANLAFFIPHLGCPYHCVFCDQNEISGKEMPPTAEEVFRDCDIYLPEVGTVVEIAFFGGSFTAIPLNEMEAYLEAAEPFVRNGRASGIRISTRPDAISPEILDILKRYGVTSIELGAQSMSDDVLRANRRGHGTEEVVSASRMIKERGFSLGLQMMIGMYGAADPRKDAEKTAERFIRLRPGTVRIYPTLVVENTALAGLWKSGRYQPLKLEEAVSISAELVERFETERIRVIRVGLHSERSLQDSVLAGPFHPAFGELCRSRIYRNRIEKELGGRKEAVICCDPKLLSQIKGQKNSNICYFAQQGIVLEIVPQEGRDGFCFAHSTEQERNNCF